MFRLLLELSRTLGDIAEQANDRDVQRALELCYAFMERAEQERLVPHEPKKTSCSEPVRLLN